MKKIGVIGGITPDSTAKYYEYFTSWNRDGSKGADYPTVVIYSLDLQKWYRLLAEDNEKDIVHYLLSAVSALEHAGAQIAIIAANTPHMYFTQLQSMASISMLSIVDSTAQEASRKGYKRLGLLGTKFTMQKSFYFEVFSKHNMEVVVPDQRGQDYINTMLFEEISSGQYLDSSKQRLIQISRDLEAEKGIDALILGCTELPLFIDANDVHMAVLDTVAIHANATIECALK